MPAKNDKKCHGRDEDFPGGRMHIQNNPETEDVVCRAEVRKWVLEQRMDPSMTNNQGAPSSRWKRMQQLFYHPTQITRGNRESEMYAQQNR